MATVIVGATSCLGGASSKSCDQKHRTPHKLDLRVGFVRCGGTRIRTTGLCAAEPAPEGGECSRSAFGSALADEVDEKSGGQTGQETALGDLGVLILAEPVQAHPF